MSSRATRRCVRFLAAGAGLAVAAAAHGQQWMESGDAGDLPGSAQAALGTGSLQLITGTIDASDADMFQIAICDFASFSATTVGQTTVDTQLFLFDASGLGVVSDDDTLNMGTQSTIPTGYVFTNGIYYLALSAYNRDPMSAGGSIFDPPAFTTVQVPNGPGAGQPVSSWDGTSGSTGPYGIALTGACMVDPAATGACCLGDGTCQVMTLGNCSTAGGSFAGADTTCGTVTCPPGGSCCLSDGTCTLLTAAVCAAQGGIWGGANTACGACTGACCLADGSCSVVSPQDCATQSGSTYLGNGTTCGACRPISFLSLPLTYNWNGMVTADLEQGAANYNDPNGYRSVADRGLLLSAGGSSFDAVPIIGTDGMTYTINTADHTLDIVHLGDRLTVANSARTWGTGTNNALQPAWLLNNDQTVPQVSPMGATNATLSAQSRIGFLYQISDSGGRFDVVLHFTDNSSATLTLRAPDWFNSQTVPAPAAGSGLIEQRQLGVYASTQDTDNANTSINSLNVVEAVTSVARLRQDGFGDFAGKRLDSITFQNPVSNANYPNSTPATGSGVAIFAASLSYPAGASCYANCDNSTQPPVLNVLDFNCFLNAFSSGQSYANCDNSTQAPVLNVLDFNCFLNRFSVGCP
jgi:hypothetical protein